MARHSAGVTTGAGSATLPLISLYAIALHGGALRELGFWNTTAVATALKLMRLTTAGTQGAGLGETAHDLNFPPQCTAFTTHTVAPTLGGDLGYRCRLGASIGAGIIWTFGDTGIVIPKGAANGVGLIVASGAGQILDAYVVWDD